MSVLLALQEASVAIARVQTGTALTSTGTGSVAPTWPGATTAGNLLVALIAHNTSPTVQPTVNGPGGWTKVADYGALSSAGVAIFYIANAASQSAAQTFTLSSLTRDMYGVLLEYSGIAASSPLDRETGTTGSSVTPATGTTGTINQADELLIGIPANINTSTAATPVMGGSASGGTAVELAEAVSTNATNAQKIAARVVEYITTGAGTAELHETLGTSRPWAGAIATFKGASGATDLVIADASHAHAADNLALTQVHSLAVADATHGHVADALVLTQVHNLAIQDAAHGHAADALVLTQVHQLTIDDAAHAHAADSLSLTQVHALALQDASHSHTADNLELVEESTLVIADALHAHAADELTLTQVHALAVSDALHDHAADDLTLVENSTLAIQDAAHGHTADDLALTQVHTLITQDALHGHAADSLTLAEEHVLTIQDALHSHTADNLTLAVQHNLVIFYATHAHTADNVSLTVDATDLFIQDATHAHFAGDSTSVMGVLWVEADRLGLADDDPVSLWVDQTPSDNDLTQPAGVRKPTYKTGILNGLPVLRFEGTGDWLDTPPMPTVNQPFTMVVVVKANNATGYPNILNGTPLGTGLYLDEPTGQMKTYAGGLGPSSAGDVTGAWHIAIATFDGVSSYLWLDGEEATGNAGPDAVEGSLRLGAADATFSHLDGDIYAVGVGLGVLTTAQRNALGTYLADKTGLTWTPATGSLSLTQVHTLAIQDATHAHSADNLAVGIDLVIQDASHGHTADNLDVTQVFVLVIQDAAHGHTADSLDLTQDHVLAVEDSLHAHTADTLALTQLHELAVQDALHAHTVDELTLTQLHILTVADALHDHAADNLDLTQVYVLAIEDALHSHTADDLILTQVHVLVTQDALHEHLGDTVGLTQVHVLVVSGALHAHTAEELVLVVYTARDLVLGLGPPMTRWVITLVASSWSADPPSSKWHVGRPQRKWDADDPERKWDVRHLDRV